MKKLFALLLALAMVFSLAACGGGDDDKTPGNDDKTPSSSGQHTPSNKPDESKPAESQQSTDSTPSDEEKLLAEKADAIAIGFGSYNGSPIKWRVLDIDIASERALLITEDCLAEAQFHAEAPEDLTYRVSDLRVWLIGDFHYSSFTDEEKERIIEVENPQDTNSETGASEPEGYETTDTVFILSATEMQKYFADDEDMVGTLNGEDISYWTRTPGNDTTGYVCTYTGGGLYMTGNQADSTGIAVRPAIWVDLSGELANSAPDADQQDGEQVDLSGYLGTKTGRFYSQFADGRMYMEYEMEMEGQTMTMISATDGDRTYSETRMGGTSMGVSIIIGEDMYTIDHASEMVIKMSLGTDTQTIGGAVLEESDVDMGDYKTGTREIDGKTYDTEEWIVEGASSIMCFDGDDLAYMIGAFEGEEVVMKIIQVSHDVDDSLFEIPDDYTVMEM